MHGFDKGLFAWAKRQGVDSHTANFPQRQYVHVYGTLRMPSPTTLLDTASDGLAFEATLFAESRSATALWTCRQRALVCPAAYERRPGFAAASKQIQALGWPVVVRRSGGGTVPQGPGVLNLVLALTVSQGFDIEDGYTLIANAIRRGLGDHGTRLVSGATEGSFCDGASNLSTDGRKVAGLAQHWRPRPGRQTRVLAHAMILTEGDLEPGVKAVNAFHDCLGLPLVHRQAHTTLSCIVPDFTRAWATIPIALLTSAERTLRDLEHLVD